MQAFKLIILVAISILSLSNAVIAEARYCPYKIVNVDGKAGILVGKTQFDQILVPPGSKSIEGVSFSYYDISKQTGAELSKLIKAAKVANGTWDEQAERTAIFLGNMPTEAEAREIFFSKEFQSVISNLACRIETDAEFAQSILTSAPVSEIDAPIPQPVNPIAVGVNHKKFRETLAIKPDVRVDSKRTKITGPFDPIVRPKLALLDAEVELGVVIRRKIPVGVTITRSNLADYVAGFVLTTDVANQAHVYLRNFGGVEEGFVAAKSYPSFLPVGPYFVPIEFYLEKMGEALIPVVAAELAVQQNPSDKTADKYWDIRQLGTFSHDSFAKSIDAVIELALQSRTYTDYDANKEPQQLLQNNQFEAGDLIIMGALPGIAFNMGVNSTVYGLFMGGMGRAKGMAIDFFGPRYFQYTEVGSTGMHDFGGPPPVNGWERWWSMKANVVRDEYCHNGLYIREGDSVYLNASGLGQQLHKVVTEQFSPADLASYEQAYGVPADIARDDLNQAELCSTDNLEPVLRVGPEWAALLFGGYAANKWGFRKWAPTGRLGKIAKGGAKSIFYLAYGVGALLAVNLEAWAAAPGYEMMVATEQAELRAAAIDFVAGSEVPEADMGAYLDLIFEGFPPSVAAQQAFEPAVAEAIIRAGEALAK